MTATAPGIIVATIRKPFMPLRLMKSLALVAAAGLLSGAARSAPPDAASYEQFEIWKADSPDHRYFAAIRRVPLSDYLWKEDADGCRLVVFRHAPAAPPYPEQKMFADDVAFRVPAQLAWTGDSKFLVFTIVSSGGHAPYRFTAYAYSVDRKAWRRVDDLLGIVVSPEFRTGPSSTVEFQTCTQQGGIDFEHPYPVKLDLNKLFLPKKPVQKKTTR